MKVLLIYPNITTYVANVRRIMPPLGIGYLAEYLLKNNIEVEILDSAVEGYDNIYDIHDGICTYGLSNNELYWRICRAKPNLVGVSVPFSSQLKNALDVCRIAKQIPYTNTILGGVHPTYFTREILKEHPEVDFIARGEGEVPLLNLSQFNPLEAIPAFAFRNGQQIKINKGSCQVEDFDRPAWKLFKMEKYFKINAPHGPYAKGKRVANIMTSRGCPGNCVYCSSCNFFGHKFRARPVESIVDELQYLSEAYGVREIQFEDDNLTYNRRRAEELFTKMWEMFNFSWCTPNGVRIDTVDDELLRLMRKSGCYQVTFGIESGSERVLHEVMKKPLDLSSVKPKIKFAREIGMAVHLFFMLGLPSETRAEMQETLDFAKKVNPDSATFSIATPLPGSILYHQAIKDDLLLENYSFDNANYRKSSLKVDGFTPSEFEHFIDRANVQFNKRLLWHHPIKYFRKYGLGKKSLKKNA